jgi:hypothetical protein
MSVHVLRHSILPSHYSDNHKLRVKFNILLGCTSAGETKGRCLRKCSILKPTLLLVSNAEEQDEIKMSERKKNHLQYLQIKSFSHVNNHKKISSILKFWKLIPVIPTILKRSCLVLLYFEQDIKKCISSSISPELHCWHILDSGGVPIYIDPIQYGDDVMIFKTLLGFSWTHNYLNYPNKKVLIFQSNIVKHVKWYGQKHMS